MKIAICDDEANDRALIKHFVSTHDCRHVIEEFSSADPLIKYICSGKSLDVLFLDIQIPDSDGWEIAEQLKKSKINIYIAMVTINANYVYDCFDRVDWFAAKPVSEARIHKILNNAYNKLYPTIFQFGIDKETVVLTAPEIMYIEVKRNYAYIHTVYAIHKVREPLKNIIKEFEMFSFSSPHQSYLINLEHYESIEKREVILKNGERVPLSRSKRKHFYNALREYVIRRKSND